MADRIINWLDRCGYSIVEKGQPATTPAPVGTRKPINTTSAPDLETGLFGAKHQKAPTAEPQGYSTSRPGEEHTRE